MNQRNWNNDVEVELSLDNTFRQKEVVQGNFGLPNGSIEDTHIIRSWQGFDFSSKEDFLYHFAEIIQI